MNYSAQEVMQYIREDDVKFIRLAFCDVFGKQKNVAIMPDELERAFDYGIAFDASAISGFGGEVRSDLLLRPDPSTLTGLPWRPENGKVVRMFCDICRPDGTVFEADTRGILKKAVKTASEKGLSFRFGSEMEFYLFRCDEHGEPTAIPYDKAGYMDIAPVDKGENIRREICLTLEKMGIYPESSHHEEGPGQNEIDFRHADALTAADNAVAFRSIVETVAGRNGLCADFSPKPLPDKPGNGMHINISVRHRGGEDYLPSIMAGLLECISPMTAFLNPCAESYERLGGNKAPGYISWSCENRSQLIRFPAAVGEYRRAELRSADAMANPYLAFALVIYAGLQGIEGKLALPEPADINLYTASKETLEKYKHLPRSLEEARKSALSSEFISKYVPESVLKAYCG